MALVTLCPGCGATYKIYPEQLQTQNGRVRCGQCQVIFNGFATLITIEEAEIEYPAASKGKNNATDKTGNVRESVTGLNAVLQATVTKTHESAGKAEHDKPAKENLPKEPVARDGDFLAEITTTQSRRHWLWNLSSVALLLLLIGQVFYFYRTDLTVLFPQARPYLEHFCAVAGCSIPLPRNIQHLSIMSSDMEEKDPEYQPDVASLTAIVRNHADYAQALPALKLFLTDRHNALLASRIVTAAEYLTEEQAGKVAIGPHQELIIRVYLDNSQLQSVGYRLQLLYL